MEDVPATEGYDLDKEPEIDPAARAVTDRYMSGGMEDVPATEGLNPNSPAGRRLAAAYRAMRARDVAPLPKDDALTGTMRAAGLPAPVLPEAGIADKPEAPPPLQQFLADMKLSASQRQRIREIMEEPSEDTEDVGAR
jgi:hypothetical protein